MQDIEGKTTDNGDAGLLICSTLALFLGAALVAVCYFFVDRPVAFFVHDQDLKRLEILRKWTLVPETMLAWSPAALLVLAIRYASGRPRCCEWTLLAAIVSMLIAGQCRESLSFCAGRYWPETWVNDNPSLIRDNAYGFHPFHRGLEYGSFPSGHTARSVGFAAVFWIVYPRWRWLCAVVVTGVVAGLIANNYHFVGDTVGGAFVGGIVGAYAARLLESRRPSR